MKQFLLSIIVTAVTLVGLTRVADRISPLKSSIQMAGEESGSGNGGRGRKV